jgi:Transposase IS200 like
MRAVCTDFGCELVECNCEAEHVHLLVHFSPTVALSRLVNSLKGVSSRRLRHEFPELAWHYRRERRLWSGSYLAARSAAHPWTCSAPTSSSNADRATRFTFGLQAAALSRKRGSGPHRRLPVRPTRRSDG